MFQKLVAIEPVNLVPQAEQALHDYAKEVVLYRDIPQGDAEIMRRIGDADGVLVSYTSPISRAVIESCPNIRYIGMCCSLYSEKSANVDICCARERGITVLGIRDYGDEGVVEYVISELVRLLHGFGGVRWEDKPMELGGLKVGIVGLGTSGKMVADGLKLFGAEVSYYSRTRKQEAEQEGIAYQPLHELLENCDMVCTCLNKNTVLLYGEEFEKLGGHKILFNTGLSPSYEMEAFKKWIADGRNYYLCDTAMALGDIDGSLAALPNVFCANQSAGMTKQAVVRLSNKVLANIETFLKNNA